MGWQAERCFHRSRVDKQTNGRCVILFSPAVSLPCGLYNCSLPFPESLGSMNAGQVSTSSRVHVLLFSFASRAGWTMKPVCSSGAQGCLRLTAPTQPRANSAAVSWLNCFLTCEERRCAFRVTPRKLSVAYFIHTEMPHIQMHVICENRTWRGKHFPYLKCSIFIFYFFCDVENVIQCSHWCIF